jgi:hypothetical protein
MFDELSAHRMDTFGSALHESWIITRELAAGVVAFYFSRCRLTIGRKFVSPCYRIMFWPNKVSSEVTTEAFKSRTSPPVVVHWA